MGKGLAGVGEHKEPDPGSPFGRVLGRRLAELAPAPGPRVGRCRGEQRAELVDEEELAPATARNRPIVHHCQTSKDVGSGAKSAALDKAAFHFPRPWKPAAPYRLPGCLPWRAC